MHGGIGDGTDRFSAQRIGGGPDDLEIKIEEIREITDWEKPIYIKIGASRPYYDTQLAVKAGTTSTYCPETLRSSLSPCPPLCPLPFSASLLLSPPPK